MTRPKRSAAERRLVEGFVRRAAQTEAPLLATVLSRHAANEGLSWDELARSLGGTSEALYQVALCRPPRAEQFAAEVTAVAAGHVDADRLLNLLRRIQVLGSLSGFSAATAPRHAGEAPGMLLAARDRHESEGGERQEDAGDSPGATEGTAGEPEPPRE